MITYFLRKSSNPWLKGNLNDAIPDIFQRILIKNVLFEEGNFKLNRLSIHVAKLHNNINSIGFFGVAGCSDV